MQVRLDSDGRTVKVTLTRWEVASGFQVAANRKVESAIQKLSSDMGHGGYGQKLSDQLGNEVLGALHEIAVAKAFGLYFDGSVNTYKAPDLPHKIQVRGTDLPNGRLIVRTKDADDELFVLCIADSLFEYRIPGWEVGAAAKKDEFAQAPNNRVRSYFVPQDKLRLPAELKVTINRERCA